MGLEAWGLGLRLGGRGRIMQVRDRSRCTSGVRGTATAGGQEGDSRGAAPVVVGALNELPECAHLKMR